MRKWTKRELGILRRRIAEESADEVARRLNRTPGAIQCKARQLGLATRRARAQRPCLDCGAMLDAGPWAKYCDDCRPRHRGKGRKYVVTAAVEAVLRDLYDSNIPGRCGEVAAEIHWPEWAVKRAARELGLTRPWPRDRRNWTAMETAFVWRWAGRRSPEWMARRLNRGVTSIILKINRLHLSRRIREGYTARDLASLLGVDGKTICRWIAAGWIEARRQGTASPSDPWIIEEAALMPFIREHRADIDLRKVNQEWFLDLVLGQRIDADDHTDTYLPTRAEIERQTAMIRRGRRREHAA